MEQLRLGSSESLLGSDISFLHEDKYGHLGNINIKVRTNVNLNLAEQFRKSFTFSWEKLIKIKRFKEELKTERFKYIIITDNIIAFTDLIKMLTRCEQKIMNVVLPQPFKTYSIKHISELIKSSYALTYDSIKTLLSKKMINADKIGHSLACRLNLSANPQILAISSLTLSQKFLDKASFGFVIDDIKNKLNDLIYIMILFGSYAKGTATKNSDVDLLFVVQNKADIEKTKKRIESVISLTNIKIEFKVIITEWLIEMFEEKHTVGREILEGSIILHGAEQYYTLVNAYDKKRGH